MKMALWKSTFSITRCTPVSSAKNKGIGKIDTYLKTRSTTVSWNREKLYNEIAIERLLKLKIYAEGFGAEMTSGNSNNQEIQCWVTSW